jgi:hypothetical protein
LSPLKVHPNDPGDGIAAIDHLGLPAGRKPVRWILQPCGSG